METLVNDIAIMAARFLGRDDIADYMEWAKDQESISPSADAKLFATRTGSWRCARGNPNIRRGRNLRRTASCFR